MSTQQERRQAAKLGEKQRAVVVDLYRQKKYTIDEICQAVGISRPTLYKYVAAAGDRRQTADLRGCAADHTLGWQRTSVDVIDARKAAVFLPESEKRGRDERHAILWSLTGGTSGSKPADCSFGFEPQSSMTAMVGEG